MPKLHGYILRQIAITALFTCAAVTIVVLFTQSFRLLALVIDNAATVSIFLHLAALTIPTFLGLILPLALAVAVVFIYHRLAHDSELVVMRAVGLSTLELARPAIVLGGLVASLSLILALWVAPWANSELVRLQYKVRNEFSVYVVRPGAFNDITDGLTFYARDRDRQGGLAGILVQDNRDPAKAVTIMADRGLVTLVDGQPRIVVFNGQRQEYDRASNRLSQLDFDRYSFDLSALQSANNDRLPDPRELTISQLLTVRSAADPVRVKSELHQRFALPLSALSFAILAASIMLSGQFNRRGMGRRVIIAAITLILLQALLMWMMSLTNGNLLFAAALHVTALGPFILGWMLLRYGHRARLDPAMVAA